MNTKIFNKDTHSDFCYFEDEIDCAIAGDHDFEEAMKQLDCPDSSIKNINIPEPEEVVDTTIDYDDMIPEADLVSIDCDNIIDAERDLAFNPCEEDETMDIAIGVNVNQEDFLNDDDF